MFVNKFKKMKNIIFTSLMLCSVLAFSQEIKFGAKVGLNISRLRGNYPTAQQVDVDEVNNMSKIGFHIGGFAEYSINGKFSIQPELLISTQGGILEFKGDDYIDQTYLGTVSITQNNKLTYLNLPIMLKYKVLTKLSVEFGPQIGYLVSAKNKLEFKDSQYPQENESVEIDLLHDGSYISQGKIVQVQGRANRLDFGLNLGTSYDLTEKIFIQVRYNLGLSVLDKNSTAGANTNSWNSKNSVFQLSAGYRF